MDKVPLVIHAQSEAQIFEQALTSELVNHPSLLKIFTFPEAIELEWIPLLEYHGFTEYEPIHWDFAQHGGQVKAAGGLVVLRHVRGEYRTIVFVVRDRVNAHQLSDAMAIAVLYHELGHADDFEKRQNLRPNEPLDLIKAELYAHHFACRKMLEKDLQIPLAVYFLLLSGHIQSNSEYQRESARLFQESQEFQKYKQITYPVEQLLGFNPALHGRRM